MYFAAETGQIVSSGHQKQLLLMKMAFAAATAKAFKVAAWIIIIIIRKDSQTSGAAAVAI